MQSRAGIVAMGVALAVLSAAPADAKKRADLFVTAVGEPPATLVAGATLTASDTVKNRGAKAKPSSTAYLLSPDEFRDLSDFVLGARPVKRLKPRWSAAGRAQVTVPTGVPAGAYRLLACADAESRIRERSERNNCRASNGSVQVVGSASAPGSLPAPSCHRRFGRASAAVDHRYGSRLASRRHQPGGQGLGRSRFDRQRLRERRLRRNRARHGLGGAVRGSRRSRSRSRTERSPR